MQVGLAEIVILRLYLALVPAVKAATGKVLSTGSRWTTATEVQVVIHRW